MTRAFKWSIAVVAVMLLCILSYIFIDIKAALWFHTINNGRYSDLFNIITDFGESQWYLITGMLFFVVLRKTYPLRAQPGLFLASSVAASGVSADVIKYIAGRARPILYFSEQLYGFNCFHYEYEWISFPSGHAATAFSAAIVFTTLYPRWRILFLFAGTLIAFSRIFLTQHYISDVIAGSFLGMASSILLYNLYFKKKLDVSASREI
ncbi:MAG: phosphatase PAP2 family protein [Chlorobiaceae bacterium]|nr:phosphatase PAP2 family protein [Chlorobiaceae bacterium]